MKGLPAPLNAAADHAQAVRWLRPPDLAGELRKALKPSPDGQLWKQRDYDNGNWRVVKCECGACESVRLRVVTNAPRFCEMTDRQIRDELGRHVKRWAKGERDSAL